MPTINIEAGQYLLPAGARHGFEGGASGEVLAAA
jgi:hypothetical protein